MANPNVLNPFAWQEFYQTVLVETNRDRLSDLLGPLESAIACRQQELANCEGHDEERAAMIVATQQILAIKTAKCSRLVLKLNSRSSEVPTVVEKIQRVVSIHHWHR